MTFDERLAALGIETCDILPSAERCDNLFFEKFYVAIERICKEAGAEFDVPFVAAYLVLEIAKRDDIIDRMETRIVNLTGERDYLRWKYSADPNETVPEDWCPDA